jgi:hypothetical protein
MILKVIACEIARREICHCLARSPNIVDLEFLPQGLHDTPARGRDELQRRIEAVPAGRYDAVLLGYGLCGSILKDLRADPTRLVIPRAHDCITFFLGSKERYQRCFTDRPGTYYFTAGWLEVPVRRKGEGASGHGAFMPTQSTSTLQGNFAEWTAKYGEEQARYLLEEMLRWTQHYTHGTLIEFDFARPLRLGDQVRRLCAEKGWAFAEAAGDLGLLQRWLDGDWARADFLVVEPGQRVVPSFDEAIVAAVPD